MTANEIIRQIAKERGISPKEVEDEMRYAIRKAMATEDPQAQALWKQLAPDGKEPSIDRFLAFCVDRLNKRRGFQNQADTEIIIPLKIEKSTPKGAFSGTGDKT